VRRLPEGMAPIARIGRAAGATGFVYYDPDQDGAVRQIVLWINHNDYLYPQLGMALACDYLGVDIHDIEIHNDRVVIPRPADAGGSLTIPVFARINEETSQHYGANTDIPWFGNFNEWTTMYDPAHEQSAQHMPITRVWSVIETKLRIENNNKIADGIIHFLYSMLDPDKFVAYQKDPPAADNGQARLAIFSELAADEFYTETLKAYKEDKQAGTELDETGLTFLTIESDMAVLMIAIPELQNELKDKRKILANQLGGRAVLIGWTATGSIADFVPTPLHSLCPGVVVHGVLFNSILNGEVWKRAEGWVTAVIIMLMSLITIAAVCLLNPLSTSLVSVFSASVYMLINGLLLFDYNNLIAGVAGPLTVVAAVWGGCTLFRFIIERSERTRITARFSSYVDPVLVNYVIEHPEKAKLDGEEKELSVVFTDLQGFTTLSEQLGKRTVGILNEYMGLMTDSIREHSGYVNKFLGDGIMFFYGAPLDNPQHAIDAMATSVRMQELMGPFNKSLLKRNLPEVFVRIGVGTGDMIVGDAGSADASDYTVLGDIVNSAARLESANKQTGTWIMCNQRCHELLEGRFLCRTIGELQVVGKSEGMKVFNPLAWTDKATDQQREMVRLFDDVVNTYTDGGFKRCIEAINVYEKAFEPYKLSKTYRDLCEQYMAQPPEEFLGRIVLASK
jgi:class 3 adenylate cyclase